MREMLCFFKTDIKRIVGNGHALVTYDAWWQLPEVFRTKLLEAGQTYIHEWTIESPNTLGTVKMQSIAIKPPFITVGSMDDFINLRQLFWDACVGDSLTHD
jgi:hypothetical protein